MTTDDAISFFRTGRRLAKLVGIAPQNVYIWAKYPPELRQRQIEELSGGILKIEENLRFQPALDKWQRNEQPSK